MGADSNEGPPHEAYGRVTSPQRYQLLHHAAADLIDRLIDQYAVERHDGRDLDPRARSAWPDSPATTLTPIGGGAALTFTLTPFPGVMVQFGYGGTGGFPQCGCDACDEAPAEEAHRMAEVVANVVAGGFSEMRHRRRLLGRDIYESVLLDRAGGGATRYREPFDDDRSDQPGGTVDWEPWRPIP